MKAQQGLGPMLTVLTTENTLSGPINAEYRVMSPMSLVPEQDLHFVLCDFGRSGQAYVETDPAESDASTIVRNLLRGQYDRPVRVLALNVEEGWVRDVSDIATAQTAACLHVADHSQNGDNTGFRRTEVDCTVRPPY